MKLLDSLDDTCLQLTEMIQAASRDETKDVDLKELLAIVNIRSGVKFGVMCIVLCFYTR